jgi:hypothetical protein
MFINQEHLRSYNWFSWLIRYRIILTQSHTAGEYQPRTPTDVSLYRHTVAVHNTLHRSPDAHNFTRPFKHRRLELASQSWYNTLMNDWGRDTQKYLKS